MSHEALNAVLERSKARGNDRLVLIVIADRANSDMEAWCGGEDIAARAGILRKNVSRHIAKLVRLGELKVVPRGGPKLANLYTLSSLLRARTPQGEASSKMGADLLKVSQNHPQGEAGTQGTQKNPNRGKVNHEHGEAPKPNPAPSALCPFDSSPFLAAWDAFLTHRKEKRKPLTKTSNFALYRKLQAMGEDAATAALITSVENGWTGVFAPKRNVQTTSSGAVLSTYRGGVRL